MYDWWLLSSGFATCTMSPFYVNKREQERTPDIVGNENNSLFAVTRHLHVAIAVGIGRKQ